MLINYSSINLKAGGPRNTKMTEVGTAFITGQLMKADIMYTDLIPDKDNPPSQMLTAVWFLRHPMPKRQVDLFKFSKIHFHLTKKGKKKKKTSCLGVQHRKSLPYLQIHFLSSDF